MAESLVASMSGDFDPGEYTDDYREALQAVIDAKVEGREVVEAEETAAQRRQRRRPDVRAARPRSRRRRSAAVTRRYRHRGREAAPAKQAAKPAKAATAKRAAKPAAKATKAREERQAGQGTRRCQGQSAGQGRQGACEGRPRRAQVRLAAPWPTVDGPCRTRRYARGSLTGPSGRRRCPISRCRRWTRARAGGRAARWTWTESASTCGPRRRLPQTDGQAAEPALFVHGLGGASTNWTDFARHAARPARDRGARPARLRPVRARRPHGDYAPAAHAGTVIGYLERSGRGAVHLVGNSMGGAVAILVAGRRPDLVRTLTLVSPAVPDIRLRLYPVRYNRRMALMAVPGLAVPAVRRGGDPDHPGADRARHHRALLRRPDALPAAAAGESVAEARERAGLPVGGRGAGPRRTRAGAAGGYVRPRNSGRRCARSRRPRSCCGATPTGSSRLTWPRPSPRPSPIRGCWCSSTSGTSR